jgi:hypothetical protein
MMEYDDIRSKITIGLCRFRPKNKGFAVFERRGIEAQSAAASQRAAPRHGDWVASSTKICSFADFASMKDYRLNLRSPHSGPTLRGFAPSAE